MVTVILVDDDSRLLEGLSRVLHKEPYHITTVNSGGACLELLQGIKADLVVSDERMPGINGTTLLAQIREKYPGIVRIMLSGEATLQTALRAINLGEVFRFLTKPCNEIELAIAIREGLKHRALMTHSQRMLEVMKMQSSYINALERENPGISHVKRASHGEIVLEDKGKDLDTVLKEVISELDATEKHFGVS